VIVLLCPLAVFLFMWLIGPVLDWLEEWCDE